MPKLRPGEPLTVNRHTVTPQQIIGEGAYAVVWCCQSSDGRQLALKISTIHTQENMDAVQAEIAAMIQCGEHPNIINYVDHQIITLGRNKEVLLLMEFAETTLLSVMMAMQQSGRFFSETEVLTIFMDVCKGVHHLHTQDPPIAHRDLKVENVLVSRTGRQTVYKLCDFGSCSRISYEVNDKFERAEAEEDIEKHTTFVYRAPEMLDLWTKTRIDEKVDVWALGVLLYYLCYLALPFAEEKLQIINVKYTFPTSPRYSDDTRNLITTILTADPKKRMNIKELIERVAIILKINLDPLADIPSLQPVFRKGGPKPAAVTSSAPSPTKASTQPSPNPKPSTSSSTKAGVTGALASMLDWEGASASNTSSTTTPSSPPKTKPAAPSGNAAVVKGALTSLIDWDAPQTTSPTSKPTGSSPLNTSPAKVNNDLDSLFDVAPIKETKSNNDDLSLFDNAPPISSKPVSPQPAAPKAAPTSNIIDSLFDSPTTFTSKPTPQPNLFSSSPLTPPSGMSSNFMTPPTGSPTSNQTKPAMAKSMAPSAKPASTPTTPPDPNSLLSSIMDGLSASLTTTTAPPKPKAEPSAPVNNTPAWMAKPSATSSAPAKPANSAPKANLDQIFSKLA